MSYIVYTPVGEGTFAQKSFATMKDLAKWAMAEALDGAPKEAGELSNLLAPEGTWAHREVEEKIVLKAHLEEKAAKKEKLAERDDATPTPKVDILNLLSPRRVISEKKPAPKPELTPADIDKWFDADSDSPWKTVLKSEGEMRWSDAAHTFIEFLGGKRTNKQVGANDKVIVYVTDMGDPVGGKCWTPCNGKQPIPFELIKFFFMLCKKYPVRMMEELGGDMEVKWDQLPPVFWEKCAEKLQDYKLTPLEAVHPLLIQLEEIYRFFFLTSNVSYWSTKNFELAGIQWKDALRLTEHLFHEWWAGGKASDTVIEFMIKMVVGRNYDVDQTKEKTVGAAEFMEDYKRLVKELALPEEFLGWATNGVQHRHCKKALEEMGITQVRRAEGQRYMGIKLLDKGRSHEITMVYAADDSIMPYAPCELAPFGEV